MTRDGGALRWLVLGTMLFVMGMAGCASKPIYDHVQYGGDGPASPQRNSTGCPSGCSH